MKQAHGAIGKRSACIVLVAIVLLTPVLGDLITTCPADQTIFRTYKSTNSHAATHDSTVYAYAACFSRPATTRACKSDRSNAVLRIHNPDGGTATNAHVEQANKKTAGYTDICFGDVTCTYATTCPASTECIASLYYDTNSHVAECSSQAYQIKICCSAPLPAPTAVPPPTTQPPTPPPTTTPPPEPPPTTPPSAFCGNTICDPGENAANCPYDCAPPPTTPPPPTTTQPPPPQPTPTTTPEPGETIPIAQPMTQPPAPQPIQPTPTQQPAAPPVTLITPQPIPQPMELPTVEEPPAIPEPALQISEAALPVALPFPEITPVVETPASLPELVKEKQASPEPPDRAWLWTMLALLGVIGGALGFWRYARTPLDKYAVTELRAGYTPAQVRARLLQAGWEKERIERALKKAKK